MKQQRVMVTGSAGRVGRAAVRELHARGHHVVGFDLAPTPGLPIEQNFVAPLADVEDLRRAARGVDVIVHLAAKAGVRPSIADPLAYERTNISGTQRLLDFAVQKKVKKFVFASSSSVYGINEKLPWKEDELLLPISPYAMTKLAGEMAGHVYHKLYGLSFIALRFFTVYGPGQRPDLAIHKFVKSILKDEPITMFGDGSTSRRPWARSTCGSRVWGLRRCRSCVRRPRRCLPCWRRRSGPASASRS